MIVRLPLQPGRCERSSDGEDSGELLRLTCLMRLGDSQFVECDKFAAANADANAPFKREEATGDDLMVRCKKDLKLLSEVVWVARVR